MSNEKFQAEINYQVAISIAKSLLKQGLLTKDEFAIIDTNLEEHFAPSLGSLLSNNCLLF